MSDGSNWSGIKNNGDRRGTSCQAGLCVMQKLDGVVVDQLDQV